ncbi:MAG: putative lipid II flippase FtsW [Lachnospiraceae bacterium]|nr:putative lipid II flippase FtsW [Lachnospiraceae bacterium]
MKKRNNNLYIDHSMLIAVILLLCFGLIMVYSASSYEASTKFNDSAHYIKSQAKATFLGLIVMGFVSKLDYHFWKKVYLPIYFGSIFLIFLVKSPIGMTINGANRWIRIGGMSFQPAEAAKLGIIIFLAVLICNKRKSLNSLGGFINCLIWALVPTGLIYVVTKNLSSAIIICGIAVVMLFVASPRYWYYILGTVMVGGAVAGVIYLVSSGILPESMSFRLGRVKAWLNPEAYATSKGFQTLQALYSIGSGGYFGKGLGQSTQKMGYVPEAQNDMIFSIICEELGLFGAVAVILMFLILIYRFLVIANNAPDLFGALLVVGVMGHISLQVILNIAVVTNTLPNTGVTLPFISYGGTSVLFLMMEIGIALNVSKAHSAE